MGSRLHNSSLMILVGLLFLTLFLSMSMKAQPSPKLRDYNPSRPLRERSFPRISSSESDTGFSVLGRGSWGPCYAVALESEYIVMGNGSLLQVLRWDARTSSPTLVSEIDLGMPIFQIRIRDSLAYIIGGNLVIVNIKDPTRMERLGSISEPDIFVQLQVVDSIAYVTTFFGVLALFNVKDPTSPYLISYVGAHSERTYTLAVKDGYCYVGGLDDPSLHIFDATNPDSVKYLGYADGFGLPLAAVVDDTFLIVAAKSLATIRFYSVRSPATPVYLYDVNIPAIDSIGINDLSTYGSHLYVSTIGYDTPTAGAGLYDIAFADSTPPKVVSHRSFPFATSAGGSVVRSASDVIYVACGNGLASYDALDTTRYPGFYPTGGPITRISVRGKLVAVASYNAGVWLVDVSDPRAPKQVSNINSGSFAIDAIVSGSRLITYDQLPTESVFVGRVSLYDIQDTLYPRLLSSFEPMPTNLGFQYGPALCLDAGVLFLALEQSSAPPRTVIEVVDISDSLHPQTMVQLTVPYLIIRMAAKSGALYVGARDSGLYVFDYRSLPAFQEVGHVKHMNTELIPALVFHDSSLFYYSEARSSPDSTGSTTVADNIFIYNISQPALPESVSAFAVNPSLPLDLVVAGNFLYCQLNNTYPPGIAAIDISDLRHLEQKAYFVQNLVTTIAATGDLVLIGRSEFGLTVLRNNLVLGMKPPEVENADWKYQLEQNYPNPFNPSTTIEFEIKHPAFVTLKIYNVLGEEVARLAGEYKPIGTYRVRWDAGNMPSGVYLCRLIARPAQINSRQSVMTRKMLLLR